MKCLSFFLVAFCAAAILGCRAPAQSAAQSSDAAQRQSATVGGDSLQETRSTTDQRQQQTTDAAPVAPQARDVGAMTITASAAFHDIGKNQLSLDERREANRLRITVAVCMSFVGMMIAFSADNIMRGSPFYKLVLALTGVGIAVAPWLRMSFMP